MLRMIAAAWMVLALAVSAALAADGQTHAPAHADAQAAAHESNAVESQPILPVNDAIWAGVAVIAIAAMFLAAAIVGPVVRANMPDEPPAPQAADDHAADHHH